MLPQLVFFSIDVIAVFSVLLFGLHVILISPKQQNARLLSFICLNTVCAILLNRQELGYWISDAYRIDVGVLRFPFHIARNLTPGLLMMLCFSLFEDNAKFPRSLIVVFALQIVMEALAWWLVPAGTASQYSWLKSVPASLELVFVAIALYWLVSGWQMDLVAARRRLRLGFLIVVGAFVFIEVLLERLVIPWSRIGNFYTHIAASILDIVLVNIGLLTVERWSYWICISVL